MFSLPLIFLMQYDFFMVFVSALGKKGQEIFSCKLQNAM